MKRKIKDNSNHTVTVCRTCHRELIAVGNRFGEVFPWCDYCNEREPQTVRMTFKELWEEASLVDKDPIHVGKIFDYLY